LLTENQLNKLHTGVLEELHSISWDEPFEDEREPAYTARAIAPALVDHVASLSHPTLVTRFDGGERPLPVMFDGQKFFPDLGVNDLGSRELAVEVKFLNGSSYSGQLATAIGQGIVYRSFGYNAAIVVLVSKSGRRVLSPETIQALNGRFALQRLGLVHLAN
jgi:hypothetical protein